MNILIVNGPNLNLLGIREPEIYGRKTYQNLIDYITDYCTYHNINIKIYQSNFEGKIIDIIQENYDRFDGLIINPAAYTHYSYAIYDCLKSISIPTIEVHLSNIEDRESFRKISVIKSACIAQNYGKGFDSYIDAIKLLQKRIK